jgi:putative transposase
MPTPGRALSQGERQQVLDLLHSERFVDVSPAETSADAAGRVHLPVLDAGDVSHPRRPQGGAREWRDQLTHPAYAKPELLAQRPNELWAWGRVEA